MKPVRTKEHIDHSLKVVENLKAQKVMADDVYYKCIVSLAYEYLLDGAQQEGLQQLMRVPISYYKEVQPKQMKEDHMYRDLVVLLSFKLIQLGVVEGADEVAVPNMGEARA